MLLAIDSVVYSTVIVLEFLSDNTCTLILYGGKLWWTETLANLANDHKFTKVYPANLFIAIKILMNMSYPFLNTNLK